MVTTFVVQTSQSLQVDYGQVTATLLFELIDVQRAAANGSFVNDVPRSDLTPFSNFHPTTSDSLVNGLWFTSLSFSLATALFAVLTKQWIHHYIAVPSGTPQDRCRVRQFRYMGLQQWGVGFIIGMLPVLLSLSLGIFLVGLVVFLAPLQVTIASIVGVITFISFAAYFVTNFLPIIYPSCPYRTPLSQYIFPLYAYITHNGFFISSLSTKSKPPICTLQDAEHSIVESSRDEMDVHALAWLFNMSSNPSVQTITLQSIGALPLTSIKYLNELDKGFSELWKTLATTILLSPLEEGRFDRLTRASFRLHTKYKYLSKELLKREKNQLSPEVYAELLSVSPSYLEISNLVKAQSMESTDKCLHLQPIVWGYLLQKALAVDIFSSKDFDYSLIQLLFHKIPSFYWNANYIPLDYLKFSRGTICSTSDRDECSLSTAIDKYLYPYVAEIIFHRIIKAWDSIFYSDVAHEFPKPQDQRLHGLLTMASSPSVQKLPITNPAFNSVFGMVMLNIRTYMDVDGFYLFHDKMPFFKLDNNRQIVLKLLYKLVSSEVFGSDSMQSLDQHITLVTFLRILKSTSHFLSEN